MCSPENRCRDEIKGMNAMNWYEKLYIGETIKEKTDRLVRDIDEGKHPLRIYLIVMAQGTQNQLEIIRACEVKYWYEKGRCPMIVGMARGRKETLELLQRMTQDVLADTGGLDFRAYFRE
jgi:hypothetical protein